MRPRTQRRPAVQRMRQAEDRARKTTWWPTNHDLVSLASRSRLSAISPATRAARSVPPPISSISSWKARPAGHRSADRGAESCAVGRRGLGGACDQTGRPTTAEFSSPSAGPPPCLVYRLSLHNGLSAFRQ